MTREKIQEELKEIKDHLREQSPRPMGFEEARTYLGLSASYLYRLTCEGKIVHYKSGGGKKLFFRKADLDAWLLAHRIPTRQEIREELEGVPEPA